LSPSGPDVDLWKQRECEKKSAPMPLGRIRKHLDAEPAWSALVHIGADTATRIEAVLKRMVARKMLSTTTARKVLILLGSMPVAGPDRHLARLRAAQGARARIPLDSDRRDLHRVRDAPHFDPALAFHRLRHTFASRDMRKGGDIYQLKRIPRHSSVKVTERNAHLSPDAFAEDRQRSWICCPH